MLATVPGVMKASGVWPEPLTEPEPLYRFNVWLRDGRIDGYAIDEKPQVSLGEETFTLTTTTATVGYAAKDVLKFTLNDTSVNDPIYLFYVWLRDGRVEVYAIEDRPQVTLGEETFKLTTLTTTVIYAAKDVQKFTLKDAAVNDPGLNIVPVRSSETETSFRDGAFFVSKGKAGTPVKVFDLNGQLQSSYNISADGTLSIPLGSFPSGAYIVKTETTTHKFIKK